MSSVAEGTGVVAVKLRSTLVAFLATLAMAAGCLWVAVPASAAGPGDPASRGSAHPHAPRKPHALATRLVVDEHYDPRHAPQPLAPDATSSIAADTAWRLPAGAGVAGNLGGAWARPSSRAPPVLL
jgi:hypothetical protein